MVSKTSEADIWLSSYDHLTDVGGQRGGCQQLSQRKRGKGDKQGESMVASYMYLVVSNPGLQMIWSNECDVSCLRGTRCDVVFGPGVKKGPGTVFRPENTN